MSGIEEILKYTLPVFLTAGFVFGVIWLFIRWDNNRVKPHHKAENIKTILPLRLQAMERIILFLERITPDQLVSRLLNPHLSAKEFYLQCVSAVRDEFEHNMTQQLYVSVESWQAVVAAKESTIHLLNKSFSALPDNSSASQFADIILQNAESNAGRIILNAKVEISKEAQKLF